MADLVIRIKGDSKDAQKALAKAGVSFKKLNKQTNKNKVGFKQLKTGALAAGVAILAIVAASKKFIDAAGEQQKQQVTLAAAMQQAGTFTEQAFRHNLEYAKSLQTMTTFGDEAILGVQKMLTNFGVEGEMMDKLTKATLDLAAAKGMDLKSAADLVAKSVGSSTNALTRYGIEVKGAVGSTERMDTAVKNITKLFGGAAAAEADTFSGRLKQLQNIGGDVVETLGFELMGALTPTIKQFEKFIKSEEGMVAIQNAAKGVATAFMVLKAIITQIMNSFNVMVTNIMFGFNVIKTGWGKIKNFFKEDKTTETMSEKWEEFKTKQADNFLSMKDNWKSTMDGIGGIWTDAKSAQDKDLDDTVAKFKGAGKKIKEGWKLTFDDMKTAAKSFSSSFSQISSGLVQIQKNNLDKASDDDLKLRKVRAGRIVKMMKFEKATQIASATISAATAVLKTMASVPSPLNIPLAIAQGVAGAVQVAAIASTPIPSVGDFAPHGADFTTDGQQTLTVGDNPSGRERVTVTPEEDVDSGGGGTTIIIENMTVVSDSPDQWGEQMKEFGILTARRA